MSGEAGIAGRRLDGWKAIAGYFRRDRSTVMRWAQERELPVHRMPGGKQGSVFALEHELAQWALRLEQGDADRPPAVSPAPDTAPSIAAPPRSHRMLAGAAIVVAVAAVIVAIFAWRAGDTPPASRVAELPADPAAASAYVAARDHWARRTPEDIARSIDLYRGVIARAPDFAPAYAGLAEAWLIAREYGAIGDRAGYDAAQTAALRALNLDPDLAAAHRAMGFIRYWRENDGPGAVVEFRRAIALDDHDAQSWFWFANVLADLGEHDAARRAYDRARLLAPGSAVIEIESACAEWQAGRDDVALGRLTALRTRYPDDATIRNCLAWLHIGRGDIAAFARDYQAMARIRGEAALIRRAAALDAAVARDPATAHRVLIADLGRELTTGERRGRETPAFYASQMGDRALLLELMRAARAAGEQWYSATITARIAQRWQGDAEVTALLRVLRAPKVALPPA